MAAPAIRTALPADAAEVERLRVAGWQAAYRGLLPDAYLDGLEGDVDRRRALITGRAATSVEQVAVAGSVIVGWVAGGRCRDPDRPGPEHGEIYACYVLPAWWGRGTGCLLLASAVTVLAAAGLADVTLWVLEGNQRARRFYEACGFAPDGGRQQLDISGPVPEVRYRLSRLPAGASGAW